MRRKNRIKAKIEADRRLNPDKSLQHTLKWLGGLFCAVVTIIVLLTGLDLFDEKAILGDGHSVNTRQLQQRINHAKSGDTIVIPKGRHVTGPIVITKSHLTIVIEGTFVGIADDRHYPVLPQFPSYPEGERFQSLITIANCTDVTIKGNGIIEGNGNYWWNRMKTTQTDQPNRPRLIEIINSSEVSVKNLFLKDSPFWNIHVLYSNDVTISDLIIHAPDDSPNTDGIVPDSSNRVKIENNTISVGDDVIAVKSGKNAPGRSVNKPCNDVQVNHNVFLTGHGISIGSEVSGGINNIRFHNNTILGPMKRGIRIKTNPERGGFVDNVLFSDTRIGNIDKFLEITTSYHNKKTDRSDVPTRLSSIAFSGVTRVQEGNNPITEIHPGSIKCSEAMPCNDLVFKDVVLKPFTGSMECKHAAECPQF